MTTSCNLIEHIWKKQVLFPPTANNYSKSRFSDIEKRPPSLNCTLFSRYGLSRNEGLSSELNSGIIEITGQS